MHPIARLALTAIPLALTAFAASRSRLDPHLDIGPPRTRGQSPAERGEPELRVMSLNLAHGRGTAHHQALLPRLQFAENLRVAGELMLRESPDLVALQEADGPSVWSGHFDHVRALAEWTSTPHRLHGDHARIRGPLATRYGTALLANLPLDNGRSVPFDENWRDSKGFVVATVTLHHTEIDVVSVHLDFLRGGVRQAQVDTLIAELSPRTRPLLVLGDLNCDLDAPEFERLVMALDLAPASDVLLGPTYPSGDPRTRIDWILHSPELEIAEHRVLTDVVSDHRALVATVRHAKMEPTRGADAGPDN